MLVETLTAELERLFELPDLTRLSRDALGFEPEDIGGVATRASFARALAEQAVESEAVEALLDAIALDRHGLPSSLESVREHAASNDGLSAGDSIGQYVVLEKLGTGPWGERLQGAPRRSGLPRQIAAPAGCNTALGCTSISHRIAARGAGRSSRPAQ
ncbi:MAG: hypothetical protein WDO74_21710 [Pseudomonadota bacterium]